MVLTLSLLAPSLTAFTENSRAWQFRNVRENCCKLKKIFPIFSALWASHFALQRSCCSPCRSPRCPLRKAVAFRATRAAVRRTLRPLSPLQSPKAVRSQPRNQRLKASNSTPAATNAMPDHSRSDGRSPRNANAKTATSTTLSLSTGATFEASPIFSARK